MFWYDVDIYTCNNRVAQLQKHADIVAMLV